MTDLFQDAKLSPAEERRATIWADARPYLMQHCGKSDSAARRIIGSWMGKYDHNHIREVVSRVINMRTPPIDPVPYIKRMLEKRKNDAAPEISELSNDELAAKIKHMADFARTRPASPQAHKLLADLRAEAAKRERNGK